LLKQVTGLAAGLGDAEQFAEIEKMALRALFFVEVVGWPPWPPFGNE
jgi:hypothetical protein